MTTRGSVHRDRFAGVFHRDGGQVRQTLLLGFLDITEQGTGSGGRARLVVQTKAAEIMQLEEVQQLATAAVGVEQPRCATTHANALTQEFRPFFFVGHQQFGRLQTGQLGFQRVVAIDLVDQEAATGQIGPGQAVAVLAARQRHQQGVAALVQQCLVGDGAGRDDAHHLALDQALGQRRVADLFADRHRFTQRDQTRQIAFIRVHRHTGHRDRRTTGAATLGQGDIQQARGLARIVVEQLVEIAHPEEQQQVRIIGLGCEELLHQRGVFGLFLGHAESTSIAGQERCHKGDIVGADLCSTKGAGRVAPRWAANRPWPRPASAAGRTGTAPR
ncbi:hypothetical protein D3C71_931260 [compost metagenome]